MSRKVQALPEYQSLVRWTVQDVVNWLSQNSMSDCVKSFRQGGVDGNKLVNVTTTDLNTINCPKRHIPEIMKLVSQVLKPGMQPGKRGGAWRQPAPRMPPNEQNFRDPYPTSRQAQVQSYNEGSASGSEDEAMWDENEFDTDDDDYESEESYEDPVECQPIAPPRPSRGLPAVPPPQQQQQQYTPQFEPQDSIEEFYEDPDKPTTAPIPRRPPAPIPAVDDDGGEDYEDPDKNLHVQNFHGGPLPTPPSENRSKNVPIAQRQPPPTPGSGPSLPTRPGGPTLPARPGAPSHAPRGPSLPDRSAVRVFPPASDDYVGEDYEEPDNTQRPRPPPLSSVPSFKHKAPAIIPDDQEEYEEPDAIPRPPPISSVPSFKHSKPAPVEPEEEYEEPDAPVKSRPPAPLGGRKPPPPPVSTMQTPKTNLPPPVPSNVPSRKHSTEPVVVQELYEVPEQNQDNNEDYLAMEDSDTLLNKVSPVPTRVTAPTMLPRRGVMPLPHERQPAPILYSRKPVPELEEQETYEIPDEDNSRDAATKKPGITNGSFLHSNRQDRVLPPAPGTVNQPKKEPRRKTTPPAPQTTTTTTAPETRIPKEFTEADLLRQRWYHGDISRQAGDELLKQYSQDGMYFIRKSSQGGDKPYTMQIYFENKTYNLPIRMKNNGTFAMGKEEKPNEKSFVNLLVLVNQFKKSPIILAGGKQTKLVKSLPKT